MYKQLAEVSDTLRLFSKNFWMVNSVSLVERVDRSFFEHFGQEHLAQRDRQLINQATNPQIFKADNALFRIKNATDLDRGLGFL